MLTVVVDARAVERQLVAGDLECPCCAEVLGPWGWARPRTVGRADRRVRLVPRRSRCRGCHVTHVLLPALVLLRRCDVVDVIGRALGWRARGGAVRAVARGLGVPRSTVRGWLTRFAERAERVREHFTRWALSLDSAVRLEPAGSAVADAVTAVVAAGDAARRRLGEMPLWEFAAAATAGRLLSNTNAPFPTPW